MKLRADYLSGSPQWRNPAQDRQDRLPVHQQLLGSGSLIAGGKELGTASPTLALKLHHHFTQWMSKAEMEMSYDTALVYHGPLDGKTWNIKSCPAYRSGRE